MSLHQKMVWLLGDISMLAVSIRLMLLGRQTSSWQTKKRKGNDGLRFICCSWPVDRCSGMSAAGDVHSHSVMATKRSSPNLNVSPITNTKGFIHMGEADIFERLISILFYRVVSFSRDAHQLFVKSSKNCQRGELYSNYCHFHTISIIFYMRIFKIQINKPWKEDG